MSDTLRIILLITSVISVIYIVLKLKNSKLQLMDALYWIIVAIALCLFGLFPSIPINMSKKIGVQSPANFVFLIMLFIVLLRCFLLSMRVSKIEAQFKELVEELSVRKKMEEEKCETLDLDNM